MLRGSRERRRRDVLTRHWLFTGTADSWAEAWTPSRSERRARARRVRRNKAMGQIQSAGASSRRERRHDHATRRAARRVLRVARDDRARDRDRNAPVDDARSERMGAPEPYARRRARLRVFRSRRRAPMGRTRNVEDETRRRSSRSDAMRSSGSTLPRTSETYFSKRTRRRSTHKSGTRSDAARTGGTTVTAISTSSIERHGFEYDYKRTDLGLKDDVQVGEWANVVLQLYAYPQYALEDVTFRPSIERTLSGRFTSPH